MSVPRLMLLLLLLMSFGISPPTHAAAEAQPAISKLTLHLPKTLSGRVPLRASVAEEARTDRVEFSIDGKNVFADYSPPFEWFCDTGPLPDGEHDFRARAIDARGASSEVAQRAGVANRAGAPVSPVNVRIISPAARSVASGTIPIEIEVTHIQDAYIARVEILAGDQMLLPRDYPPPRSIFVEGHWVTVGPGSPPVRETALWNTTDLEAGSFQNIRARATDQYGNTDQATTAVQIGEPPPPEPLVPWVEATRQVLRRGNYFEVALTVRNRGVVDLDNLMIEDKCVGFQCVNNATIAHNTEYTRGTPTPCPSWMFTDYQGRECRITAYAGPLPIRSSVTYTYRAVPLLANYNIRCIGGCFLTYWAQQRGYSIAPGDRWASSSAVDDAFKTADYLIVTNPSSLFAHNASGSDVNALLSAMAELATEKNGVLGYLYAPSSFWADFGGGDSLGVGDVDGNGLGEILVARSGPHEVSVYDHRGMWLRNFHANFSGGRGFAVAKVRGDPRADVVVGDSDSHNVYIYDDVGSELLRFDADFHSSGVFDIPSMGDSLLRSDALAVGDFDGDGTNDIIVAHSMIDAPDPLDLATGGDICVHDGNGRRLRQFDAQFRRKDALAVADINGDRRAEVIIARDRGGKLDVYGTAGTLLCSVDGGYSASDGFAVGNLNGGPKEVLVAKEGSGRVNVLGIAGCYADYESRSVDITSFNGDYTVNDGFTVGDLDGDGSDEVVIAGDSYGIVDVFRFTDNRGVPETEARLHLKELLGSDGEWSARMKDGWTSGGYLLIVGETPIIPAGMTRYQGNGVGSEEKIRLTDLHYGNTAGEMAHPELTVGRIIGDTPDKLILPIQASLADWRAQCRQFDFNSSLLFSGHQGSEAGKIIWFYIDANQVRKKLADNGFSSKYWIHSDGYVDPTIRTHVDAYQPGDPAARFLERAPGRDVIFVAGHGSAAGIDDLDVNNIDYQNTEWTDPHPVVFCSGCLTGRYAGGVGFAKACLEKGAAVFIGATEISYQPPNRRNVRKFFEHWDRGEAVGRALRNRKRNTAPGQGHYWSAVYNCYGDPKYGAR